MKRGLAVVLIVLSLTGVVGTFWLDAPVRAAVVEGQGKQWNKGAEAEFHRWVRKVGDWPWLMVGAGAGLLLAWKLDNRRWMRIVAAAMLASTLAGLLVNTSRLTTGRTRPRESPKIEQGFYGPWHEGKLLIGNSKFNSFPSGHTATAFGFAWPIVLASPGFGMIALAGAGLIAWSSLALGAHHPSDIAVSIFVSFFVGWFVLRWVNTRGEGSLVWVRQRLSKWRPRRASS